ncbi:GIY-YIG nuclease family protein [Iodobacter arcticus]|uniref:GIY-YIG nuclease family protein n=1 Tax=Iodobacter arcticus TaxID=590593 RepID=A0ABW2QZT8_9NEIS
MNKDQIIKEIQRTAETNGGVPLGRQRFLQETGIKESDWIGRFWTKWSDAIQESGYSANKMQNAFPDEQLLEHYALLVRELGYIPTSAEVKMRARNGSEFPSHNTFSRLGSKQQLLNKLYIFCQKNHAYSDLAEILEKATNKNPISTPHESITYRKDAYVYLLQFGQEYKIGSSNNVERRFREIKTQMPYEGKIIHTITTGDPAGIETYWHNYFKEQRLKGEWFKLSASDIKYFKKRKLM